MKTFQIPAILESYRSMKDRGLKVSFETGELSPENVANVQYSFQKAGYLVFSPDPLRTEELEEIDKLKIDFEDMQKSAGQRLRAVLFLNWKQNPEGYKTSVDHYNSKMETIIEHFKSKLV